MYSKLKNKVTQEIRKAKLSHFEVVVMECKHNPRKAWKQINSVLGRGSRKGIDVVRTEEGLITDLRGIVDEYNVSFSSLTGTQDTEPVVETICLPCSSFPVEHQEFKFKRIEEEEMLSLLERLDVNQAQGVDGVSARLL